MNDALMIVSIAIAVDFEQGSHVRNKYSNNHW
jgi:hypothetical protein